MTPDFPIIASTAKRRTDRKYKVPAFENRKAIGTKSIRRSSLETGILTRSPGPRHVSPVQPTSITFLARHIDHPVFCSGRKQRLERFRRRLVCALAVVLLDNSLTKTTRLGALKLTGLRLQAASNYGSAASAPACRTTTAATASPIWRRHCDGRLFAGTDGGSGMRTG